MADIPKALNPSPALLCKLGSAIVHIGELHSSNGHAFDKLAIETILTDPEVIQWCQAMDAMGMLPKKRHG